MVLTVADGFSVRCVDRRAAHFVFCQGCGTLGRPVRSLMGSKDNYSVCMNIYIHIYICIYVHIDTLEYMCIYIYIHV